MYPTPTRILIRFFCLTSALALGLSGCSVKKMAMRSVADSLSEPGNLFSRDDDPELVRDSLPVLLKLMEQLRDGLPEHAELRLALTRGFTSYGVAFVQEDADRLHETNVNAARQKYYRARLLFRRAVADGVTGLDLKLSGFKRAFDGGNRAELTATLARCNKAHVPYLYWIAAAVGSMVSVSKDNMAIVGELPKADMMLQRALALDPSWDEGALHEIMIPLSASKSPQDGGGPEVARKHFEQALALSRKERQSAKVSYAEAVLVDAQKKAEFTKLLQEVVQYDVDKAPNYRLANVIARRRAEWLLSRANDLFAN